MNEALKNETKYYVSSFIFQVISTINSYFENNCKLQLSRSFHLPNQYKCCGVIIKTKEQKCDMKIYEYIFAEIKLLELLLKPLYEVEGLS